LVAARVTHFNEARDFAQQLFALAKRLARTPHGSTVFVATRWLRRPIHLLVDVFVYHAFISSEASVASKEGLRVLRDI
jgi:hypothetical protein